MQQPTDQATGFLTDGGGEGRVGCGMGVGRDAYPSLCCTMGRTSTETPGYLR